VGREVDLKEKKGNKSIKKRLGEEGDKLARAGRKDRMDIIYSHIIRRGVGTGGHPIGTHTSLVGQINSTTLLLSGEVCAHYFCGRRLDWVTFERVSKNESL
jgi:hypothetical protein